MSPDKAFSEVARRPMLPGAADPLDHFLLCIVDGGLAGCIFVVPFLLGGRHSLGQLVLATLAVVVALAWTVRQSFHAERGWRWSGAELLLFAGLVLLLLQLAHLPQSLLRWLAPHTPEILPLWISGGELSARLGAWSQVSLTPAATRAGLVLFLAYSLLFLVTVQRIRTLEDVERLLRWCALSAILMAAFGLVQFLTSNGKFFWFYEHPYSDTAKVVKGSFTNRNHFAHFLALGIGPLIWWVQQSLHGRPRRRSGEFGRPPGPFPARDLRVSFRVLALGIVLFAILLSLSRGGALATLLAAGICAAVCYRASLVGNRFVLSLSAAALLIGVSLAIFGYDRVSDRLDDLTAGSVEAVDRSQARRTIWGSVTKAIPDYAVLGSGVGSLREVYPMYLEWRGTNLYYTHSENGYLQVALETGVTGLGLLVVGIWVCGFWCIGGLWGGPSARTLACVGAVSAGLAASVLHSLVDFVWYVPACMAIVAVLAACACRLWQLAGGKTARRARRIGFPRPVAWALALGLVPLAGWMLNNRIGPALAQPHWERFRILQRASLDPLPLDAEGVNDEPANRQAEAALAAEKRMIAELEEVVRRDPEHARAHLQLAKAYMRVFHQIQQSSVNVMSLGQIGDAVVQSEFPSRRALDEWLSRAVGDHAAYLDLAMQHTRKGLALSPLLGEGYLYLGDLCFLEGVGAPAKAAYLDQAMKVRPFDGTVLFHAGTVAWLNGDPEQWLLCWQRSFHSGPMYQRQMIEQYAGHAQPEYLQEEIRFFLEVFQPDLVALRYLDHRYRELAAPDQLVELRRAYAGAAEAEAGKLKGKEAAGLWLEAMKIYGQVEDDARRLLCARNAIDCEPNRYYARYQLALCLIDQGQFAEAEEHLIWCRQRRPGNPTLENQLREVVKQRHDRDTRTAASDRPADYLR